LGIYIDNINQMRVLAANFDHSFVGNPDITDNGMAIFGLICPFLRKFIHPFVDGGIGNIDVMFFIYFFADVVQGHSLIIGTYGKTYLVDGGFHMGQRAVIGKFTTAVFAPPSLHIFEMPVFYGVTGITEFTPDFLHHCIHTSTSVNYCFGEHYRK
jgi:hypothetical protein